MLSSSGNRVEGRKTENLVVCMALDSQHMVPSATDTVYCISLALNMHSRVMREEFYKKS